MSHMLLGMGRLSSLSNQANFYLSYSYFHALQQRLYLAVVSNGPVTLSGHLGAMISLYVSFRNWLITLFTVRIRLID